MKSAVLVLLAWGTSLLLAGCCCTQPPCDAVAAGGSRWIDVTDREPTPTLPDGPYARDARQSAWAYLLAKYDTDGNGSIDPEEHGRGEKAFKHLDRDGDGTITESDLGPGPVHLLMVRMMFLHWFQEDANPMAITEAEFAASFDAHDQDTDGELTSAELAAAAKARGQAVPFVPLPPAGMDPFLSLRLLSDTDKNGSVSRKEALALFGAQAPSGVWLMRPPRGGKRAAPPPGATVGSLAPDFTLRSPDGSRSFTLSSFKGKKAVALIFGSYT